jgi:N-acetylmuramoyl-L-alanine amidase
MTYLRTLCLGWFIYVAPAHAEGLSVLIDPGHGGSNTGAPGRGAHVFEKRVTLQVARLLAQRLRQAGAEAELTRQRDRYLTLRERSRLANALRPTCFVSLHTNASPDHARRGIETFVLAREAVDVDARRHASHAKDVVAAVLADLEHLETARRSLELARTVQAHLSEREGESTRAGARSPLDRGVKQAGYDVLAGVEVPAILVELGFIDHPVEGPELLDEARQARIAEQLAAGILEFARPSGQRIAQR